MDAYEFALDEGRLVLIAASYSFCVFDVYW